VRDRVVAPEDALVKAQNQQVLQQLLGMPAGVTVGAMG
jgi:hypothetical protein